MDQFDFNRGVLKIMLSPSFPQLRGHLGPYLIDKTKLIEKIVDNGRLNGHVDIVLRPRGCGKSTMLKMLKTFFSVYGQLDYKPQAVFNGLDIASRQDICTEHMGKYPVLFFDLKGLTGNSWDGMLSNFKDMVSDLYMEWKNSLTSLNLEEWAYFESICLKTATEAELTRSLCKLSQYLAWKFNRRTIVLIDDYETPINHAYDHGYFDKAYEFFGRGLFRFLLKSNQSIQYAVLAGVIPIAKSEWHSTMNDLKMHALHTSGSIFAGMLMFTRSEIIKLKALSRSQLELEDLNAHYGSYIADHISVLFNPILVIFAIYRSSIENVWIATGEFPLLNKKVSDNGLDVIEDLLIGATIEFELIEDDFYNNATLSKNEALTLLYYAGYLTMTANGQFKIPNLKVMTDWIMAM